MTKSKKMGRPKLPKAEVRNVFSLRFSTTERRQIEAKAKREGKPVTRWARNTLLDASA